MTFFDKHDIVYIFQNYYQAFLTIADFSDVEVYKYNKDDNFVDREGKIIIPSVYCPHDTVLVFQKELPEKNFLEKHHDEEFIGNTRAILRRDDKDNILYIPERMTLDEFYKKMGFDGFCENCQSGICCYGKNCYCKEEEV